MSSTQSRAMMSQRVEPDDIFVAVMGMTGTGKSTFISRITREQEICNGHSLISCTSRVSIHTTSIMGRTLHLIDTPGFDDSERPDIETLQELTYWLASAHERGIGLNGIVYLHRISDTRLQGSALRSLDAFKAMCGEEALHGVVLATTMWDTIPPEDVAKAVKRQEELQDRVCRDIQGLGGRIVALSAAEIDGMKILQHIVQRNNRLTLRFQQQIMVEKLLIHETDAGKILLGTTSLVFDSLQSSTGASQRVMADLVSAGQLKDDDDAHKAINEMKIDTHSFNKDLELTQLTLAGIRNKWEENLIRDDVALEQALVIVEKLSQHKTMNMPSNNQNELSLRPIVKPVSASHVSAQKEDPIACSTTADSADLVRKRREIMVMMETRLNRRQTSYERSSHRVSIIGTGLAMGQLVATLACTVM